MMHAICDLLHKWPLGLITFWMFPLFFATKMIELGGLGIRGRGIPFRSSRDRWGGASGKIVAWILLMIGYGLFAVFACWLCVKLWGKLISAIQW